MVWDNNNTPQLPRIVLFWLTLFCVGCFERAAKPDFVRAVEQAQSTTVLISRPSRDPEPDPSGKTVRSQVIGSGLMVSSFGHVLTNAHVVGNLDEVTVTLADLSTFVGMVKCRAEDQDLALICLDQMNFPHAGFANRDPVKVGDWVLAAGYPLGQRLTVTHGIVSALEVDDLNLSSTEAYIQTDLALTRGYSGGPLLNLSGEVVGLNTAISAFGPNMSFAIPNRFLIPFLKETCCTHATP